MPSRETLSKERWPEIEVWRWSDGDPQLSHPGAVSRNTDPQPKTETETYVPASLLKQEQEQGEER